jgi:iron complex transport system substrate-binding protein
MFRALALVLAMMGLAVVACSRGASSAPAVAKRVVSLGPATTEGLFAIGAGVRMVGRSRYCDYPPEATKLPAVGGIEPDLEAILQLHPDLVVGPSGVWSTRFAKTLEERGIATWFPAEITSLDGVDAMLLALGDRTGTRPGAEQVVATLHQREASISAAVAGKPRPRVLFVVGLSPVVVAGPASFADDLIRRAGGTNAMTDGGGWPAVSFERLVELDPDVILDSGEENGPTQITPRSPGWSGVRAVREGHVVSLHDERVLRPGPRVAEGLAVVAHALHPEALP